MPITLTALEGLPLVKAGDDLCALMLASDADFADGDVVVLAQKIVSKTEGRTVDLRDVTPSPRAEEVAALTHKDARLVELILSESNEIVRAKPGVLVVEHRLGLVLANAGIDQSNVEDAEHHVLLLPTDPDGSAARLRREMERRAGVDIAVLIIDSIGRAWRSGTVGTAIGVAGLPALHDLRGAPDLYGRALQSTEIGLADEIAAAASLAMGQADEGRPVVIVRGVPYARREGRALELLRPRHMDMFR